MNDSCGVQPLCLVHPGAKASRGFTAVELMVVAVIVAVLAALAVPGFKPLIQSWRVRDARDAMTSALYLARAEAIKHGGRVILQKNALGADCPQADTRQDWGCGWVVYFDANGNSKMDAGEQIQMYPAPKSLNVMITRQSVTKMTFDRWGSAGLNAIGFVVVPYPDGVSSPATTTLCMSSGGRIRYDPGFASCN